MKRIIATTALALMLGTSAYAGNAVTKFQTYEMKQQGDIYASEFIGMRVYAAEKDYDGLDRNAAVTRDEAREWDDIGEVNDVILGRDGSVKAVVLGVGGFIGIGEKDVAVPMNQIKLVREKDDKDDFFLVVKANKKVLTDAQGYKRSEKANMKKAEKATENSADKAVETETEKNEAEKTAKAEAEKKERDARLANRPMLRKPDVNRDGYREAKNEELTTETLTGARVYGSNNEDIGEIDRLIIDEGGKVKHAVVDVGGFLGIGEHPIAVTMDELRILRTDGGDDVRVYIDATQSELEKQPAYED